MALLWMDGFDKIGDLIGGDVSPAYVMGCRYTNSSHRVKSYAGRESAGSMVVYWNVDSFIQTPGLTTDDTLIVGFSMYCPDPFNTGEIFQLRSAFNFVNDDIGSISLVINADRSLTIKRGLTTLASSAAGVVTLAGWVTVETKIVCDNVTGSYEVRIDDVDVLSATGVDTQQSIGPYHSVVRFNGALAATHPDKGMRIDDLWVCDSVGSMNDFLGSSIRITTLSPNADGDTSSWTPDAGGTHYTQVDEVIQVSGNYVESSDQYDVDLYKLQPTANMLTPLVVQVVTEALNTEPSTWTLKTVVKHGVNEDEDSGQTIGHSEITSITRKMETNPLTANNWQVADIDALQTGVKVG